MVGADIEFDIEKPRLVRFVQAHLDELSPEMEVLTDMIQKNPRNKIDKSIDMP